ncbi:hypothetical protein ACO22_05998 [Paracoccidioides brasiliensis]|uniref:Uncharacterized protein n=1 Tax=Paracoccidioides brasiliensis TaxID=121759 RepID=A0A1D2J8Q3_PARBR|nr:hypothetical protein ACO22_05998 [Paracoccidioides brasiliensis]
MTARRTVIGNTNIGPPPPPPPAPRSLTKAVRNSPNWRRKSRLAGLQLAGLAYSQLWGVGPLEPRKDGERWVANRLGDAYLWTFSMSRR